MDEDKSGPDAPLSASEVWLRKAREDLPTAAVALEVSIEASAAALVETALACDDEADFQTRVAALGKA